jgi:hypothetical protein
VIKAIIVVFVPVLLFITGGIFLAERNVGEDWIWSGLLFLIGYQWVFCYLLNKNMYTLYVGEPLLADSERSSLLRVIHFTIGSIICISSSVI